MRKKLYYLLLLIPAIIIYIIIASIYVNETSKVKINYTNKTQLYSIYLSGEVTNTSELRYKSDTRLKDFIYDYLTPYADLTSFNEMDYIENNKVYVIGYIDKININKCTLDELKKLDDIGNVRGNKIIENRPYNKISDLLSNNVIGGDLYEKIKNHIMV